MDEALISQYLDETFYNKKIQYEQAIKEIEQKSFASSKQASRPAVSREVSRRDKEDSTYTRSNYFDPSQSELSETQGNETNELDASQIDNIFESRRKKEEQRKRNEERRESLFHQFKGSRLS